MKRMFGAVAVLAVGISAFAADYHWTGKGVDGKWTNPANWQENEIPGQCKDQDDTIVGAAEKKNDVAIFGAVEEDAATTIDLNGQYLVGKVVVTNGAPSYTFGADTKAYNGKESDIYSTTTANTVQNLGIANGGEIRICRDVTADQVFHRPALERETNGCLYFYNDSPSAMFIFHHVTSHDGEAFTGGFVQLNGVGAFTFDGMVLFREIGKLKVFNTGALYINDKATYRARFDILEVGKGDGVRRNIEILPGGKIFGWSGSWPFGDFMTFKSDAHIKGDGVLFVMRPYFSKTPSPITEDVSTALAFNCDAGVTVSIDSGIVPGSNNGWNKDDRAEVGQVTNFVVRGAGTFYFNSTNAIPGKTRILESVTLCAKMIGNKNCPASETSIAVGDTIMFEGLYSGTLSSGAIATTTPESAPAGTLKYTGPGSETDRTIMVSNCFASVKATNTFANAGTGVFTLNSPILLSPEASSATFCLAAETAPLVYNGTFEGGKDWELIVKGDDLVTIANVQASVTSLLIDNGNLAIADAAIFPNAGTMKLKDSSLRLTGVSQPTAFSLSAEGASEVEVPAGAGVTISSLQVADASSLNFVVPENGGASIAVTGAAGATIPSGVMVNGVKAVYDANGNVVPSKTAWMNASNGLWSDASAWDNGIPDAAKDAFIRASGSSYAVTLDATTPFAGVFVGNETEGETAELLVDDSRTFSGNTFNLEGNGGLTIAQNRTVVVDETSQINLASNSMLKVSQGAKLVFGSVAENRLLNLNGGSVEVSGEMHLTNSVGMANFDRIVLGTGSVKFTGTHGANDADKTRLRIGVKGTGGSKPPTILSLQPGGSNEISEVTFEQKARFCTYEYLFIHVCDDVVDGKAYLSFNNSADERLTEKYIYPGSLVAGYRNGYGEVNVSGGRVVVNRMGIFLGSDLYANETALRPNSPCHTKGVLNVTGGRIVSEADRWQTHTGISGFIVGNGRRGSSDANQYEGEVNLSGTGLVKITKGGAVVGAGVLAKGTFNQSGGEYSHVTCEVKDGVEYRHPLVLGFEGGVGSYKMTGGEAMVSNCVFVGGAAFEDLLHLKGGLDTSRAGFDSSTGLLDISGGTWTCASNILVGAYGTGTIQLSGTGVLETENLVLSNKTASVLKYVFDGQTGGTLKVNGILDITDGAKLHLDLSAYTGNGAFIPLAMAGEIRGEFDDVVFNLPPTYKPTRDPEVSYVNGDVPGLYVKFPPTGTVLIIR